MMSTNATVTSRWDYDMTLQVVEDGRICQDCALIVANGEDGCEDSDACPHGNVGPHASLSGDIEDNGSEFYVPWRPCPGCGTTLTGSWFEYVVLGPVV
jgi:RNA polymerase subunit RPABC4/transcription elongation factor Spt4